jgi:hypothetical protein
MTQSTTQNSAHHGVEQPAQTGTSSHCANIFSFIAFSILAVALFSLITPPFISTAPASTGDNPLFFLNNVTRQYTKALSVRHELDLLMATSENAKGWLDKLAAMPKASELYKDLKDSAQKTSQIVSGVQNDLAFLSKIFHRGVKELALDNHRLKEALDPVFYLPSESHEVKTKHDILKRNPSDPADVVGIELKYAKAMHNIVVNSAILENAIKDAKETLNFSKSELKLFFLGWDLLDTDNLKRELGPNFDIFIDTTPPTIHRAFEKWKNFNLEQQYSDISKSLDDSVLSLNAIQELAGKYHGQTTAWPRNPMNLTSITSEQLLEFFELNENSISRIVQGSTYANTVAKVDSLAVKFENST